MELNITTSTLLHPNGKVNTLVSKQAIFNSIIEHGLMRSIIEELLEYQECNSYNTLSEDCHNYQIISL